MSRITSRSATGPLAVQANGTWQKSTDADLVTLVGSRWDTSDGRELILVSSASNTSLAAGKLYQDQPIVGAHQNIAVTAYQAYSNNGNTPAKVTVTLGAHAVVANFYRGGFLVVNDVDGEGQTLRIASHPAAAASASLAITLEDGPITGRALGTSSEVCLIPAHGADVVIHPTAPTNVATGVALTDTSASTYSFLTAKGITSALSDASVPSAGVSISASTTTAGAITTFTTLGASGQAISAVIGTAAQAGVSTEYRTVYLNL